jgi:hypothetical protein
MQALLLLTLLAWAALSQCGNNCLLCLSPPDCSLCLPAYSLALSGNCITASIPNCRVYASASSCQICRSTFKAVNGTCQKDLSGCMIRSA